MQRLAWEQEPNAKKHPVHAPPFYGGVSMGVHAPSMYGGLLLVLAHSGPTTLVNIFHTITCCAFKGLSHNS
jgi:hypothetical protein